ncbi:PREDICTED: testis-specific serine/threonine-protein kinase 1-like, partial [Priapulus caudatus]|uniref:Testis-specific serine/threonine-protein kinase 1-like n=1 Tax=Priapulus caudatus TaxID=37621 RepID=A0ABM1F880_PRICU
RDIVSAIAYCHSQKVSHRDLKADNILLTADGKAKLADFGFAKRCEEEGMASLSKTFCGTPDHCSPE